jgi:hypothetical protein
MRRFQKSNQFLRGLQATHCCGISDSLDYGDAVADGPSSWTNYGQFGQLSRTGVSLEKVPQLMLVAVQCSGDKQARVRDAVFHHSIWRPAAHDGAPIPLRSVVLLLPPWKIKFLKIICYA